ncbi:MAG: flavodoxin [Bacteroidaceae bacterium]|nr:flavodoxin [Bacteroidaceae bacterium]
MKTQLTLALLALVCTACTAQTPNTKTETAMNQNSKALVVYFSHAGENYAVGNIEVGNTKIVADFISEKTGADQFEVVCVKDYDMSYARLIEVAKAEAEAGELPAYKDDVDTTPYDTVFIGGPVWWGTYPQVMLTFLRDHDLNGKTVVPFTTHEGSGLASCVDDVRKAYPRATIGKPFAIYGHEVRNGRDKVEKWLGQLGY